MSTLYIKNTGVKIYDAGYVQRREWMLHKIRPDRYPFNIPLYFEIDSFDPTLVQKTINIMIERHEVLRTTLSVSGRCLKQIIHKSGYFEVDFTYHDMEGMSGTERYSFYNQRVSDTMGKPFDFEQGPLFLVQVFRMNDSRFLVHFIFHHLISDQHSLGMFANDISRIYSSLLTGSEQQFSGLSIQYKDYTYFENQLLETSRGDSHRDYWRQELKGGFPGLRIIGNNEQDGYDQFFLKKSNEVRERMYQLPYYDERFFPTLVRRYQVENAGEVIYTFPDSISGKIRKYKDDSKNGVLSLFVGGLLLSFHKLSGQTSFVFEIAASRRPSPDFNETMGWIASAGPCFFDVDSSLNTSGFLNYIDRKLYNLSGYCHYPYETMAYNSLRPPGSRMPVFFTLSYSDADNASRERGITFKRSEGSGTYQDMAFFLTLFKDSVTLNVTYNNFLLTSDIVESLIDQYTASIDSMLLMPGYTDQ